MINVERKKSIRCGKQIWRGTSTDQGNNLELVPLVTNGNDNIGCNGTVHGANEMSFSIGACYNNEAF